jgi:hypothetical protein
MRLRLRGKAEFTACGDEEEGLETTGAGFEGNCFQARYGCYGELGEPCVGECFWGFVS